MEMKVSLYAPLKFYLAYVVLSLLLFAFGPWPWPTRSFEPLYIFMSFAITAIWIGFLLGVAGGGEGRYYGKLSIRKLYHLSLVLTLVLFIPTLMWRTSGTAILKTILDPGAAYAESHDLVNLVSGKTAWIEYIRIVLAVYLELLIPMVVVFWGRWNRGEHILGVVAIISNLFLGLATGTNKGIGDTLILVFWSYILCNRGRLSFRVVYKSIYVVLPLMVLFFVFFTVGQITRNGGSRVEMQVYGAGITADSNNIFVRYLPPPVGQGAIAFSSYMTQGYHGLALALQEPFVFTWGVGSSRFATSYADKYWGTNFEQITYPMRVEKKDGWDSKRYWCTIFPWLASDVTFPGSILLIGFFSFLLAKSWKEAINLQNPFAISLFMQLAIMFSFISANNQVMQSGEDYVCLILTLAFWLATRKKFVVN